MLHDYLKEDPGDETTGIARRVLRRLERFDGRSLVRILLGRAELLALFAGAVDGSTEAKGELIRRLEELFAEHVEGLTRRPFLVALVALPVGYALVPAALALLR